VISENIKIACIRNGFKIGEVEKAVGLGNGTISKWNTSSPSVRRLKAVADYIGVSLESLLEGDDLYQPSPRKKS
jgi:transcriptional regulator with XRE-family HTH domain